MAQFAKDIPEGPPGRQTGRPVADAHFLQSALQFFGRISRHAQAREIALGIGQKDRHTGARQLLGHALQGHGLAVPVAPVIRPWRLARAGRSSSK
jgi:hypothetical protein